MAISSVGTPTAATGTASPVTATYGSGQNRSAGNVLIAVVTWTATTSTTTTTLTGGSGWVNLIEIASSGTLARTSIWWKTAAGADTAPQFSSTLSGTATSSVTIFELSGANGYVIDTSGTVAASATLTTQTATTSGNVTLTGEFGIAGFARERASTASVVTASGTYTLATSNTGVTSTGHFGTMTLASPATGATSSATINYSLSGTTAQGAGAVVIFGVATAGSVVTPLPQPPGGRVTWARIGTALASLIPAVTTGPPPSVGPAFYPAHSPIQARIPVNGPRGHVTGNIGARVNNPTAGPPFRQATQPARPRQPLPPRGRTSGNPGAPVSNPVTPAKPGAALPGPVRARVPQPFSRGRATATPRGQVRNPTTGPPLVSALAQPAGARVIIARTGHTQGIPGAPVAASAGAAFPPLTQPVRARQPLPARGRTSGGKGAPPANPTHGPPVYPLHAPARARQPLPPRGRTAAGTGAPVRNPAPAAAPFYPLHRPVAAVRPLPAAGRAAAMALLPPALGPAIGPPFALPSQPARAHQPLPPTRGRTAQTLATSPPPFTSARLCPLTGPVRARTAPPRPRNAGAVTQTTPRLDIVLLNNFDGGTNGANVTTGNSGGVSGNAFNSVGIGSGGTLAYSTTWAYQGTVSALCQTTTANATIASWGTSMGTQGQVWFRAYLYFPANPAGITRFFGAIAPSGTGCARFAVSTTGKILVQNGAGSTITTSTASIPLGQWFRVEGYAVGSATLGQTEVKLFTSPASTTAAETNTATSQNTLGQFTSYAYGPGAGTANQGPFYMDAIGLSNMGYLGPISVTAPVYPLTAPVRARQPRLTSRTGWASGSTGATPAPPPATAAAAPPLHAPPIRTRPRPPFLTGRAATMAALPVPVAPPPVPVPAPPLQSPAGVRVIYLRTGSAQALPGTPPPVPAPLAGRGQPIAARRPLPLKGRTAGGKGAPVSNPAPVSPVSAPALHQPARARITALPLRGRAIRNPGAPVTFPMVAPVLPGPAGILAVTVRTGSVQSSTHTGAPVHNPTSGPLVYPQQQPARARQPLPHPGRATGSAGAPLHNPVPAPGPPFYPARQPARIRIVLPPRGRVAGNPGAQVHNPAPPPAAPLPLRAPVRAQVPLHPRAGRTTGNLGVPPASPAPFRPATQPARAHIPQTWSKGRAYGNAGAPVQNPAAAQLRPLNKALRAQPPVFSKGRIASSPGAPVRNPTSGAPFPPLGQPVHIRFTLPPRGRAGGDLGKYFPFIPPVFLPPGQVYITPGGPLAAQAAITPAGPLAASAAITSAGAGAATVSIASA